MAETTGIAWCDSTFNPWIGCTKVSPGCDHCYAEAQDARGRWDGGKKHWGVGVPRYRTSAATWKQPLRWNKLAETQCGKESGRWLVFCASLADVFDNEVPHVWRHDLWKLILNTPNLTWLLLTKRIGNVLKMWPAMGETTQPNIWLGASVVNQEEANRDIPKLLATPAAKRFVSYEPALGPVDFKPYFVPRHWYADGSCKRGDICGGVILDWVIVGGESGPKARPFAIEWARWTIRQCKEAGVPVFMKQVGSDFGHCQPDGESASPIRYPMKHRAGADPSEWPEDLRIQEFPNLVAPTFGRRY